MNQAAKRPVNLKARADLISEAKAYGINLSAAFETALETAVKDARAARWEEENREAFAAYDRRVQANGVFSDGKRRF